MLELLGGGCAPVAACCFAPRDGGSPRAGGWRLLGWRRLGVGGAPISAADSGDGLPAVPAERIDR
tara:strand:+ start:112 stop:306 length:195 start_codon:yes stop_codon:yes gene_type:complete